MRRLLSKQHRQRVGKTWQNEDFRGDNLLWLTNYEHLDADAPHLAACINAMRDSLHELDERCNFELKRVTVWLRAGSAVPRA